MDRARLRPGGHRCRVSRDPPPEDPPRVGIPVAFQRVQRAAAPDERRRHQLVTTVFRSVRPDNLLPCAVVARSEHGVVVRGWSP